jgi:hypothetical protein
LILSFFFFSREKAVGCAAHSLHLLAQDLLASDQSVFADLVEFVKSLQEVIYCFTKSNLLRAQLKQLQANQNLKMLVRHCPTRWCSMQRCCESLLDSDAVLNAIVAKREFASTENRARVKEIVQGAIFFLLYEFNN